MIGKHNKEYTYIHVHVSNFYLISHCKARTTDNVMSR